MGLLLGTLACDGQCVVQPWPPATCGPPAPVRVGIPEGPAAPGCWALSWFGTERPVSRTNPSVGRKGTQHVDFENVE